MGHPAAELAKHFSWSTSRELQFLASEYGCTRSEGIWQPAGNQPLGELRVTDFVTVPGLYTYHVRYRDTSAVLDLTYGDKELILAARVFLPDYKLAFHIGLLLEAARIPRSSQDHLIGSHVGTPERIDTLVQTIAHAVRAHWPFLRRPTSAVLDRALVCLGRPMRFDRRAQREKDRESACIRASEAFHRGDRSLAAELLAPFLDDPALPEASLKLFRLASRGMA